MITDPKEIKILDNLVELCYQVIAAGDMEGSQEHIDIIKNLDGLTDIRYLQTISLGARGR